MGTPAGEPDREPGETRHDVSVSSFAMGRYEITQGQWARVMGTNPSHFASRGEDFPVERVSLLDIREFLRRLNKASRTIRFRLPTEAEWEYACRAGTTTAFAFGRSLTRNEANIRIGPEPDGTSRVGSYSANPWGLFDMHGNVWEWTEDDFCPYADAPQKDPVGRCESGLKVIRGGSWYFGPDSARCGLRYTHPPKELGFSLGFRVVALRR